MNKNNASPTRRRDMRKTGPLSLARFLLLDGGIAEDLTGQKGAREGGGGRPRSVLSSVGCGLATLLSFLLSLSENGPQLISPGID